MKPVVIVGAGLAGLICARTLKRHGVPFLIIEADDRIGGGLKTDLVGEMRLDRGHQVYLTAYPAAKDEIDEDKLDLRQFQEGIDIVWDGDHHIYGRDFPVQSAMSSLLPLGDKLRLTKWASDVGWLDDDEIAEMDDEPLESYLRRRGFSSDFVDRFARPFFGGMFLDRGLSTSCRPFLAQWKALNAGITTIPKLGIEEIPRQIAATFSHESLMLGTKVESVLRTGTTVTGVQLEGGEVIEADRVVLACGPSAASHLSGIEIPAEFNSETTLYFTAPTPPVKDPIVVVNGNMKGLVNHVVPLGNLRPISGTATGLISATILGIPAETDEQLADIVRAELRLWFTDSDVETWHFLRAYRISEARRVQTPATQAKRPSNASGIPGLYFAGEFTTVDTIDGAVQSGLACAGLILNRSIVSAA